MEIDKRKVVQKWGPVINSIGINNKQLCLLISVYCELYSIKESNENQSVGWVNTSGGSGMGSINHNSVSMNNQGTTGTSDTFSTLPKKLKEVKEKLMEFPKIKVVNYWYNRVSCKLEYELENGDMVDTDDKFELTNEQLNDLFGDLTTDVLKEVVGIEEFREGRINEILK